MGAGPRAHAAAQWADLAGCPVPGPGRTSTVFAVPYLRHDQSARSRTWRAHAIWAGPAGHRGAGAHRRAGTPRRAPGPARPAQGAAPPPGPPAPTPARPT